MAAHSRFSPGAPAQGRPVTRIATTAYRYKRPPKKRKAVAIAGAAVVRKSVARPGLEPPLPNATPSLDVNSTDCWVRLNSRSALFQFVTEFHIFFAAAAVKSWAG